MIEQPSEDRIYGLCPICNQPVIPERTHNGIAYVWHVVHCGWGHECEPYLTKQEAYEKSKYDH